MLGDKQNGETSRYTGTSQPDVRVLSDIGDLR